jgi:CHASE2 domain-containing sensor protein
VTALGRRIRRGRPLVVALRVLAAVGVSLIAVLAAGWQQPATAAVITGAVTWLLLTTRSDLS